MKKVLEIIQQSFIAYILKLRLTKGNSQQYLALKLNISQNSYCLIESGKTKLTLMHMYSIAHALDIDLETILKNYFSLRNNLNYRYCLLTSNK